jgi:DDE family transposase
MEVQWFRRDKPAVLDALRHGQRPLMAATMASGPLDEMVALHIELGIFEALDALPVARRRDGIADPLLLRTLATLPFLPEAGLDPAAQLLFQEPALLLRLGWAPAQIQSGDNRRHRHPEGRQAQSLPCHPDTLRDELRRVEAAAWLKAQKAGVAALYDRQFVRGKVYAIDGSGLGKDFRLVCLVCVSGPRPVIVAWRLLEGEASEKGREAAVTRELIEQALDLGGPDCIGLLLADALYADGPLIAWLAYEKGIDVLTPLPTDRLMYADALGLARSGLLEWTRHRYVRTIRGQKQMRTVEVAAVGELTSWDSFVEAARGYGVSDPGLWVALVREIAPQEQPLEECLALVSTRRFADGYAALQAYRPRWHIENDGYRELKEGFGLEEQRWGRDAAAAHGRTALTILAFHTARVDRTRGGQRLAEPGIRRLGRRSQPEPGRSPVVIFLDDCDAVLAVEAWLAAVGLAVRQGLLPQLDAAHRPLGPL